MRIPLIISLTVWLIIWLATWSCSKSGAGPVPYCGDDPELWFNPETERCEYVVDTTQTATRY